MQQSNHKHKHTRVGHTMADFEKRFSDNENRKSRTRRGQTHLFGLLFHYRHIDNWFEIDPRELRRQTKQQQKYNNVMSFSAFIHIYVLFTCSMLLCMCIINWLLLNDRKLCMTEWVFFGLLAGYLIACTLLTHSTHVDRATEHKSRPSWDPAKPNRRHRMHNSPQCTV